MSGKRAFTMGLLDVMVPVTVILTPIILILLAALLFVKVAEEQQSYLQSLPQQNSYVLAPPQPQPQHTIVLRAPQQ